MTKHTSDVPFTPEEEAIAAHYAGFGIAQETCRRIARLMASHEGRLTEFCDTLRVGLVDAARAVEIRDDGTIVHFGSLYVSAQAEALVPNMRVLGLLNLQKYNEKIDEIPSGVAAYGFAPNAATAPLADEVEKIPYPKDERPVAEKKPAA